MSDITSPYQARYLLNPIYWPMWLVVGLLYLTTLLPYRVILAMAHSLGWIGFYLMPQRRRVMRTNVRLTNPEFTETQIRQLLKKTFYSSTLMLFEVMWAWWGSDRKMQALVRYEGLENLRNAEAQGKGVILLGGHYTNIEILGRFMAYQADNIHTTYKRAHNRLFELLMTRNRRRMNKGIVASNDMRGILKLLKQQQLVWYAPDQDFGMERSVFAPFLGVQTATLTMTARLAKAAGAPVVPLFCERLPGTQGYVVRVGPPLSPFPTGDDVKDATTLNAVLEQHVRRVPDQYMWGHRRFKTRPRGERQVYALKRKYLRSYTLTHALISPLVFLYTVWTGLRQHDNRYIVERLGLSRQHPAELIVHAASIGEVNAVAPLIELLLAKRPHTSVLFSVNTPSGRRTAKTLLGNRVRYCYMPIDWRWSVYRYIEQVKPQCVWIMETELWPNFSEACYFLGIRNFIINARLSSRSMNVRKTFQLWQMLTIQYTYAIFARSDDDANRYLALGAAPDFTQVTGNLKYASLNTHDADAIDPGRDYVLFASSRDGEEKQIVQCWLSLPGDKPMLVIVPRHIHRSAEIVKDLEPLTPAIAVRSKQDHVTATTDVYLADTFGELKGFIHGARFVIMGGSFEPFGGQNIIEVASASKAVIFGPHMDNFLTEAQEFIAASAALQVKEINELRNVLTDLLNKPEDCKKMGTNGRQLVQRYKHIGEDYLEALLQHCPTLKSAD